MPLNVFRKLPNVTKTDTINATSNHNSLHAVNTRYKQRHIKLNAPIEGLSVLMMSGSSAPCLTISTRSTWCVAMPVQERENKQIVSKNERNQRTQHTIIATKMNVYE